jgi:hypothetical protein
MIGSHEPQTHLHFRKLQILFQTSDEASAPAWFLRGCIWGIRSWRYPAGSSMSMAGIWLAIGAPLHMELNPRKLRQHAFLP